MIGTYLDIVRDNLVLYLDTVNYKCYPRSGTSIYNLVNLSEAGTLLNGATFNTITGAIDLDGINDYIDFPNPNTFNPYNLSNYSTTTWIKNDNSTGGLVAWLNVPTNGDTGIESELYNGNIYIAFSSGDYGFTSYPTTGEWVNFTIVFDGTLIGNNRLKFYINGIQANLTYWGSIPASINNNVTSMTIGLIRSGVGNKYIQGSFGYLLAYNSSLTSPEVMQNYNATKAFFN